jgi:hypothetical protein
MLSYSQHIQPFIRDSRELGVWNKVQIDLGIWWLAVDKIQLLPWHPMLGDSRCWYL